MPAVYLGPTIATAVLLPPIRWMGGNAPTLPVSYPKQAEKAVMLSGARRVNMKSKQPRTWRFPWEALSIIELERLILLNEENRELWFHNGWEDIGWKRVWIAGFDYEPNVRTGLCGGAEVLYGEPFFGDPYYGGGADDMPLYSVTMTLEELPL